MIRQYELIDKVLAYNPDADVAMLNRAYVYSMKAHGNQQRKSGEPYLIHPLAVGEILADLKMDDTSIAVGLLHDVIEDTLGTYEEIEQMFGKEVADLTDGLTKLAKIKFNTKEEEQAENFRKLLLAMADDIRVLIIKLADRLHNMRTMHHVPKPEKRVAKARETLDIFVPLAERIGLYAVKTELEDWCFKYLNEEAYTGIRKQLDAFLKHNNTVDKVMKLLREEIKKAGIEAQVEGRVKTVYSIHNKMVQKNLGFDEVSDIIAYRVLVRTKADCYHVLGMMHDIFKAIPGRFKDYISSPKPNGYQSLHTSVIGPMGDRMEVQIRTFEMHDVAENGVAAHFQYKRTDGSKAKADKKEGDQYKWLKQLVEQLQETADPEEFFNQAKLDLFSDSVFVFTPQGDLLHLPAGATPLDFAFNVHTQVGLHCQSARVNGRIVPLRHKLRNGDQVEIVTSKNQVPSPAWRDMVVTGRARSAINRYLTQQNREQQLAEGKILLEKALGRVGVKMKEKELQKILKDLPVPQANLEEFYVSLAQGHVFPRQVVALLRPEEPTISPSAEAVAQATAKVKVGNEKIDIEGLTDGMAVNLAKCCTPLPGESIVGVVNTGRGVTIHTSRCPTLEQFEDEPERILQLNWKSPELAGTGSGAYSVRIQAAIRPVPGALSSVTTAIFNAGGNITDIRIQERKNDVSIIQGEVEVTDRGHYERLLAALRSLNVVLDVERLVG